MIFMFYTLQTQHKAFNANFHTGKIVYEENKEFNWIYDCGSVSLVRQYLKTVDKIDVIFISHFDSDHVRGLPALLASSQAKNARIVVPYLTDEDITILFCGDLSQLIETREEKNVFGKFIGRLLKEQSSVRKSHEECRINLSEENERYKEQEIISIKGGQSYSFIINGKYLKEIWVFKTHVFEDKVLRGKIQPLLYGTTLKDRLKDFTQFVKDFRGKYTQEIRKIKKTLGAESRNVMTMSMVSMPVETPKFCCCGHGSSAWLHTGDAYLSDNDIWNQFLNFCTPYKYVIDFCVLPHHASVKSTNNELYKTLHDACNYIITPSSKVSFSYPPVKNVFCVVMSNFKTIYTRHNIRCPFAWGSTYLLESMRPNSKCKHQSKCFSICKKKR